MSVLELFRGSNKKPPSPSTWRLFVWIRRVWLFLLGGMTARAGYRSFCVGLVLFLFFVTSLAIIMESDFEIELLLIGRQLLFTFDGRLVMTGFTLLYGISLFPNVLSIFEHVMALVAGYLVIFGVLLVSEVNSGLCVRSPDAGFDGNVVGSRLLSSKHHHRGGKNQYRRCKTNCKHTSFFSHHNQPPFSRCKQSPLLFQAQLL